MKLIEILTTFIAIRPYTNKEIEQETGEFFNNKKTMKMFPGLFSDVKHMSKIIKDAPVKTISISDLKNLQNSDAMEILKAKDKVNAAKKLAKKYDKNIEKVFDALNNDTKLPPPIILKSKNGLYLLAGNTRLMAAIALKINLPVKIIDTKNYENK